MNVPRSAPAANVSWTAWPSSSGRFDAGGGGGDDGRMEARVAQLAAVTEYMARDIADLKVDVRKLRDDIGAIRTTDFRLLFGAIITVALGMSGLMAKGFHWL